MKEQKPVFLHYPFPKSGTVIHCEGWPTVGEVDLMIEFLTLVRRAATPEPPIPGTPEWWRDRNEMDMKRMEEGDKNNGTSNKAQPCN